MNKKITFLIGIIGVSLLFSTFVLGGLLIENYDIFSQYISSWDVSNVTDMTDMFYDATSFNQDISSWDVSNVTNMHELFWYASSFNRNISFWDVSSVTDMGKMFEGSAFNQNIRFWDVSNVTYCNDFSDNAPLTEANTPNFTNCTP